MINCLIVDDEPLAREVLRLHLAGMPGWNVVQECESAAVAFEALIKNRVQVLFLDIQMPRVQGTEFMRLLKEPPMVIFTTAHAGYAVEGFELNAVDYLLKPVTLERLKQATAKVEMLLNIPPLAIPQVPVQQAADSREACIFIKQDNRMLRVSFDDILFLEAKRDFTMVQLKNKKLLAGFHLKMLEDMLPPTLFMRVHRSFIVNLGAIDAVYGNSVEIQGIQVPVSTAHKAELTKALRM